MKFFLEDLQNRKLYELPDGISVLGRSSKCRVCLEYSGVSRQHAEIRVEKGQVSIKDLGSSNGVKVNGKRADNTVPLKDGDVLGLGSNKFMIREGESEESLSAPTIAADAVRSPESTIAFSAVPENYSAQGPEIVVNVKATPMGEIPPAEAGMVHDAEQLEESTPVDLAYQAAGGQKQAPGAAMVLFNPAQPAPPGVPPAGTPGISPPPVPQAQPPVVAPPKKLNPVRLAIVGVGALLFIILLVVLFTPSPTAIPAYVAMEKQVKSLEKESQDTVGAELNDTFQKIHELMKKSAGAAPEVQSQAVGQINKLVVFPVRYKLSLYKVAQYLKLDTAEGYKDAQRELLPCIEYDTKGGGDSNAGNYTQNILGIIANVPSRREINFLKLTGELQKLESKEGGNAPLELINWAKNKRIWADVQQRALDCARAADDLIKSEKWSEARAKLQELYELKDNLWSEEWREKYEPMIDKGIRNKIVDAAKKMVAGKAENWQGAIDQLKKLDTELSGRDLLKKDQEAVQLLSLWSLEAENLKKITAVRDAMGAQRFDDVVTLSKDVAKESRYAADAAQMSQEAQGKIIEGELEKLFLSGNTAGYNKLAEKSPNDEHRKRGQAMLDADKKIEQGEGLIAQKKYEEALAAWEQAKTIMGSYPDNPQSKKALENLSAWTKDKCAAELELLGDQQRKIGDFQQARNFYERARALTPEQQVGKHQVEEMIAEARELYIEAQGNPEREKELLGKAIKRLRPGDQDAKGNPLYEQINKRIKQQK